MITKLPARSHATCLDDPGEAVKPEDRVPPNISQECCETLLISPREFERFMSRWKSGQCLTIALCMLHCYK